MTTPLFVQAAQDPTLIAGIYDTCDQWCTYCPATDRCLAYRCRAQTTSTGGDMYRSLADRLFEGLKFLKDLSDAEHRSMPELDAMLANDPRETVALVEIDDPLERMGFRYVRLSDAYLRSRRDFPFEMKKRDGGPTPFEVFAWYHALVPAKVYRALVSAARAAGGDATFRQDALTSAKVALIGMDRSLEALALMAATASDARLDTLRAHLSRWRREFEARFSTARRIVRPGLDVRADLPRA